MQDLETVEPSGDFFLHHLVLFQALRDDARQELDAGGVDAVALVCRRHALALELRRVSVRTATVARCIQEYGIKTMLPARPSGKTFCILYVVLKAGCYHLVTLLSIVPCPLRHAS